MRDIDKESKLRSLIEKHALKREYAGVWCLNDVNMGEFQGVVIKNGTEYGEYKRYWQYNGNLYQHCLFDEHRQKQFWCYRYYPTGEIQEVCFYKHDRIRGKLTEWHQNGNKAKECFYIGPEDYEYVIFKCVHVHGFEDPNLYQDPELWGSYKKWDDSGALIVDEFKSIMNFADLFKIKALVKDVYNITDEEKLIIKIVHDIDLFEMSYIESKYLGKGYKLEPAEDRVRAIIDILRKEE